MGDGTVIVADFGKTLAKLTLWSRDGRCLDRVTRANTVCRSGTYAALDVAAAGDWLIDSLGRFAGHPVEAIIPVAHGAAVVGVQGEALAFAPLDYEQPIPPDVRAWYDIERDGFAVTGSPVLPLGLNLGVQLAWLEELHGDAFRAATLMPYAQYWAWLLSGVAVSEVTSLGCHTDLWQPASGTFSAMAKARGWAGQFAPLAHARDAIGSLRPDLARRTGMSPGVRIHAGLHDSNAALHAARGFAEIAGREATVLSTGTWFIAMRCTGDALDLTTLPQGRDCLVNVALDGTPVPSARFMGGREIETLIEIDTCRVDIVPDQPALLTAVPGLLATGAMLLPTIAPGCGPFPDGVARWIAEPEDHYARRAAVCLYAALVADTSLDLIGARETLLIEGRFSEAEVFVRALAALRPDTRVYVAKAHNDVSFGALRLLDPAIAPQGALRRVVPLDGDLDASRARWHAEIAA